MWLSVKRSHMLYILDGMLPYLQYKDREAILTVQLINHLESHVGRPCHPLPDDVILERVNLVESIRDIPGRRQTNRSKIPDWCKQMIVNHDWAIDEGAT